jgi:hypothetical protein
VRWFQYGLTSPIFRQHGARPVEPWDLLNYSASGKEAYVALVTTLCQQRLWERGVRGPSNHSLSTALLLLFSAPGPLGTVVRMESGVNTNTYHSYRAPSTSVCRCISTLSLVLQREWRAPSANTSVTCTGHSSRASRISACRCIFIFARSQCSRSPLCFYKTHTTPCTTHKPLTNQLSSLSFTDTRQPVKHTWPTTGMMR